VETQLKEKPLRGSQTKDIHYSEDKASYKPVALTYSYAVVVLWTLTCNPTRTLPNQVTYLKGSSIELFTLRPTPKTSIQHSNITQRQRLERDQLSTTTLKYNSLSSTEFNTEFLQFSSLGTSIYRLQVQMSVWLEIHRRRPDGRHKASRQTTMQSAFQISQKFFLELSRVQTILPCRPDGLTLAARNFHIKAWRIRTIGSVVQMVDLMHAISIYEPRASGPRGLTFGCLDFECTTCLTNERVQTRIHIARTVAAVFPYLCFGKKSHSWSNTEWRLDVLLKRPDSCKLEQFEASQHRGRSG
jgi:hypothetical protein